VQRNQVRDYLDTVALAERMGSADSVAVLADIDTYYRDRSDGSDAVLTALIQRLSEPSPRDVRVTGQLPAYKGLVARWQDWSAVVEQCQSLADAIIEHLEEAS